MHHFEDPEVWPLTLAQGKGHARLGNHFAGEQGGECWQRGGPGMEWGWTWDRSEPQVNYGAVFKATCKYRKTNSEVGYAYKVLILGVGTAVNYILW